MHGDGTFEWKDGTKFVGKFVKNTRTEQGVMTTIDGTVINNPRVSTNDINHQRESIQNLDSVGLNKVIKLDPIDPEEERIEAV